MWPVASAKKHKLDPFFLVNEEFPEESDDDDYKPGPDEFQDQSEDETGRQSVVSNISKTSTLDLSANHYFESFDSNLLIDESPPQPMDQLFKMPEENIGQRTRSKLCLSDTPLEIIEKAFIPPDITTDMYDFQCDNEDWENFLKDFMQPLSNDTNDPDDDEADPDYNAVADEEEVDKEELRQDRAVKISRKELRKLMAELFESPDEYSSDEEGEKRVRTEITNRVDSDMKKKAAEKSIIKEELDDDKVFMTKSQRLLLDQQLRQCVQLTTQNFLQTCQHPLYSRYARECKILLANLVELAKMNENTFDNIFNLKEAFALVENWEKFLLTGEGEDVIQYMKSEVEASLRAARKRNVYRVTFHPELMKLMLDSKVFMYSLFLPPLGFRCDGPFKVEFVPPEDWLLAIGLEEFTKYLEKNPRWCDKNKTSLKAAVDLVSEHLLVTKKPCQVYRHIRNVRHSEGNPIYHFFKYGKAPKTIHYVVPFNDNLKKAPRDHTPWLLPQNFRDVIYGKPFSESDDGNTGKDSS